MQRYSWAEIYQSHCDEETREAESKIIEKIHANLQSFENGEIGQFAIQVFLDCMLRFSCLKGYEISADLLLEKKANMDSKGINGFTALMHSSVNMNLSLVQSLLIAKADIHIKDDNGETAFMKASKIHHSKSEPVMLSFIDFESESEDLNSESYKSSIVDTQDNEGITPLMHTIIDDCNGRFCSMVNIGANLNIQDFKGKTALIHAVELQRDNYFIESLSYFKADLNIKDNEGQTALMKAVLNDDSNVINMLLQAGADPNIIDNNGQNAAILHFQNYTEN